MKINIRKHCLSIAFASATALIHTGVAWAGGGLVALQTADGSCEDDSTNIYVDCGNGTVTDNRTGLVWLKNASCFGQQNWREAMEIISGFSDVDGGFCAEKFLTDEQCDCGLSDGSSPGEWRLPSASEWWTMVADALGDVGDPDCTASPPTITNDNGAGCQVSGPSSFTGVEPSNYWSSSTWAPAAHWAWDASLFNGEVHAILPMTDKYSVYYYVWPVRGGQ